MERSIEAVIFDADGTVLDTREMIYQAYNQVFGEHGYEMPSAAALIRFGGSRAEDTYRHFARDHDPAFLYSKHRAFQESNLDLFTAYEGFDALMAVLKKEGLKIGICTNRASNVVTLLEHLDIKHHFDEIMHADLVERFKPDPEGLLKICGQLGVAPSAAVMVGDTDADIGAGKAAGVAFTIGVTHGAGSRDMLVEAGADHIVDHLNDITPLLVPAI